VNKAVLINPPVPDGKAWVREGRCQQWTVWGAPFPPLSLALVSTQLVREGVDTMIIDAGPTGKDVDSVIDECVEFRPDLVVLSVATPTIRSDLGWFAPRLKEALPNVPVAALGIHVSALPSETLQEYRHLDFAVIGEPEITVKDLARALMFGDCPVEHVPGLALRDERGGCKINRHRTYIDDLDSLGFPDWGKIDLSLYRLPIVDRPFSLIASTRGCPFGCTFCAAHSYYGKALRKRSVESIIKEIEFNISLGVRDFLFFTELMTLDRAFLEHLLDSLHAHGLGTEINWVCNSRTDAGDRELFAKMRRAGCWQIAFGFEFGSDEILGRAGKGGKCSTSRGRKAAEDAASAGLVVDGHFILGFPGETEETLQATIDYACSLPLTFAHFYSCVPFPGSRLHDEARAEGWLINLTSEGFSQDEACLDAGVLSPVTVNEFIRKAYRKFYLRPQIVGRILRIARSANEFVRIVGIGVRFGISLLCRSADNCPSSNTEALF
jgi:anaerobic magnesium-protoporphyrin IX monomethyl ester cyclase